MSRFQTLAVRGWFIGLKLVHFLSLKFRTVFDVKIVSNLFIGQSYYPDIVDHFWGLAQSDHNKWLLQYSECLKSKLGWISDTH